MRSMMAAVESQRKRKCVCSSRMMKLEGVVKELDSRLNVVEESLFGMDSMRGRMFQLEKSMENALDRIMPRLDALLAGLPASATNQISTKPPLFRPFPPFPGESSSQQARSPLSPNNAPTPASNPNNLATLPKSTGGGLSTACSGCRSKMSCTCTAKNGPLSEAVCTKKGASNAHSTSSKSASAAVSARNGPPTEVACTRNSSNNNRSTSTTPTSSVVSEKSGTPLKANCAKNSAKNSQSLATVSVSAAASAKSDILLEAVGTKNTTTNSQCVANAATSVRSVTPSEPACAANTTNNHNSTTTSAVAGGTATVLAQKAVSTKPASPGNTALDNKSAAVPVTAEPDASSESPEEELEKQLRDAAESGNVVLCQKLVLQGVDPKKRDSVTGDTPLHCACRGGHLGCIMMLIAIAKNTAVCTNKQRQTPLMIAAVNGHTAAVQLLVHQSNPCWNNKQLGGKALRQAASDGHEGVVRALLEGAVCPNQEENPSGPSPLHAAASNGHDIIVLMLIHKGVDISYCDSDGQTALHKAAMNGHSKCVAALLHAGANPLDKDASGWEALHLAARAGHIECVKLLLASGVDVNRPAANGEAAPANNCPKEEEVLFSASTALEQDSGTIGTL